MSVISVAASEREDPEPRLGEVLDFMRLIWQVDHALQRRSKRMEAELGITGPQRLVLRIVGRFPGVPAGHLARVLHLHPSTLTGTLKRLERQRLIRKRLDSRDGRRVLVSLTDEGRALDDAAEGTVETAIERVLSILPADRIEGAREVLSAVARSLDTTPGKASGPIKKHGR
jgi:DNA-binding MarR family transcriptional regulator